MIALVLVMMAVGGIVVVGLLFIFVLTHSPQVHSQNILLTNGLKAKGKIIAIEETGKKLSGTANPIVKLTVQIYLPQEPTYNSSIEVPVSYSSFPSIGMPVEIMVNPKDKEEFIFAK